MLRFMGLQRVRHDWATELNWYYCFLHFRFRVRLLWFVFCSVNMCQNRRWGCQSRIKVLISMLFRNPICGYSEGDSSPLKKRGELSSTCLEIWWWEVFVLFFALPRVLWGLSSLTKDQTHTHCSGSVSINHWTTRGVPRDYYFLNKYLFIYLAAHETFRLHCGMRNLSLWHVGSSALTRDQTQVPCIGSLKSLPLHHQGSPLREYFKINFSFSFSFIGRRVAAALGAWLEWNM